MGKQVKFTRTPRIQYDITLEALDGSTSLIIVDIDVDTVGARFVAQRNRILALQDQIAVFKDANIKGPNPDGTLSPEDLIKLADASPEVIVENWAEISEASLEALTDELGTAVHDLFCLAFGEDQANTILNFYEHNLFELQQQVFPFLEEYIFPDIDKALKTRKNELRQRYTNPRAAYAGENQ